MSDRRRKPVYHDPKPHSYRAGSQPALEIVAYERAGPGWFGWSVIALVAFVLVDHFLWDGYYRGALVHDMERDETSIRATLEGIWRPD